jgi:hypothetical protein
VRLKAGWETQSCEEFGLTPALLVICPNPSSTVSGILF